MKLPVRVLLIILILFLIFPSGCLPQPLPTAVPSQTPVSTATQKPAPTPTVRDSSQTVLAACPVSQQSLAMRPSQIPDWDHLGLFSCYHLSLELGDGNSPFLGSETLTFANLTGSTLADIVFRTYPNATNIYGGKLTVTSTHVNGTLTQMQNFLPDSTALRVLLNPPLPPSQSIQIQMEFALGVPINFGGAQTYGIFNQSAAGPVITLANWFPILAVWSGGQWQASPVLLEGDAVTSESALFDVTITTPLSWNVAATGKQVQVAVLDGKNRLEYVSGPVRDFMISASPNFNQRQVIVGEITITQWGLPDTSNYWDQALNFASSALDYYNQTFGNYPFNELDIVAVPLQNASGVEYPGLILIHDSEYKGTDRLNFLRVVIAHETAHQWWYSVIGDDVLQDPWQDEALATFSSLIYLQSISSPIYPSLINQYKDQVAIYDRSHPQESITQPLSAFQGRPSAYSLVVYLKGALFFYDLRAQMGDSTFFRALHSYYQTNLYRLVPPSRLVSAFSISCGCDLSQVEKQYGVSPAIP